MGTAMKTLRTVTALSFLGLGLGLTAACDENPDTPPFGSLELTTSAATVQQGFTTTDGWAVKYTHFVVNVSSVTVQGNDNVIPASATAQVLDLVPPEPQVLVTADNRVARAWEKVSFEIAPTTADSAPLGGVSATDVANLATGGISVFVQGTMTKDAVTKSFSFGFTPDTKYEACTGTLNGLPTPGLVVPKDGKDTAAIGFTGDVLFFDNLVSRGHVLRGDPIAKADANNDGSIDNAELTAVTLDTARAAIVPSPGSIYESVDGIADLNGFMNNQARSIVATFRDTGTCTPSAVTAAP